MTDHIVLRNALQDKTNGRRSARLNEWALYLSTFQPRMKIVHQPGTSNGNADGLSRTPTEPQVITNVFPATVMQAEAQLLEDIDSELPKDLQFAKIYDQI